MNHCKTEKMATRKCGHMLKRISPLEEERVPAKNSRGWKIARQKKRVTRMECKRLGKEFEVGGSMAQKELWNIKKSMLEHRGALPREDGDLLREYQAMH